jgi:hypothetical protein
MLRRLVVGSCAADPAIRLEMDMLACPPPTIWDPSQHGNRTWALRSGTTAACACTRRAGGHVSPVGAWRDNLQHVAVSPVDGGPCPSPHGCDLAWRPCRTASLVSRLLFFPAAHVHGAKGRVQIPRFLTCSSPAGLLLSCSRRACSALLYPAPATRGTKTAQRRGDLVIYWLQLILSIPGGRFFSRIEALLGRFAAVSPSSRTHSG